MRLMITVLFSECQQLQQRSETNGSSACDVLSVTILFMTCSLSARRKHNTACILARPRLDSHNRTR